MLTHFRPAITLLVMFTLLLGLAYPLAITGAAQLALPYQANGSQIVQGGKVVGSALIGQDFTGATYFHPRPSAAAYNASASSGSNLGPLSQKLMDRVTTDVAGRTGVAADAVTTSASGLDPDISVANAVDQVARVAAARGLPVADLTALVAAQTTHRLFGLIGVPHVNVLRLNLALDNSAAK